MSAIPATGGSTAGSAWGQGLLAAVEAAMIKRGCRRVRICAKATNLAVLRSYESAGYAPYEVILSKSLD